jgi:beta-lactamase regulating signal transducer with metallopeptidase domain
MQVLGEIQTGDMVALGWTLLHFCWQSTAIAIVYALVDRCSVRAAASVRYGIALGALALMPLVFFATFAEQEQLVSHVHPDPQQFAVSQLGAMHTVLIERLPAAAPVVSNGELWVAEHADPLLPCIDGLWLAGVLLLALRAGGSWWKLQSLRRRAEAMVPETLRTSFDKLVGQFRLSRRIVLRVSDEVISPMVFGIWRTVVLVPLSAVTSLAPEQLEAVLAHELAHVRRWDYLINLLQTSVECLFFFQPAVWWVSRRAREFREVCCDEVAAKVCSDPVVYAEALLRLEEQRAQHLQLALGLHGEGGTLLNRIRRVMGERAMEPRSMSGVRMAAVAMVLMGLYIVPQLAHGMRSDRKQTDAAVEASPAPMAVAAPTAAARPVEVAALPEPTASPEPAAMPAPVSAPVPNPRPAPAPTFEQSAEQQGSGIEYLQKMRDAGYPLDLNKDLDQIVALRSVGVTPEYARGIAQAGLGTPTLRELISLKSVGVTPEYIASLKGTALAPASLHDVVAVKSMGITPEYARSLESLGLGTPTMHDVVSMKSVGVTPEYIAAMKASGFAPADLHEAVSLKAVGVTPEYAREMAAAGFSSTNARDLISMKAQGMTPDYAKWLKATFPEADSHTVRQAAVFHVDADFVSKAKANGFNSTSLDKLNKLKISGLLN